MYDTHVRGTEVDIKCLSKVVVYECCLVTLPSTICVCVWAWKPSSAHKVNVFPRKQQDLLCSNASGLDVLDIDPQLSLLLIPQPHHTEAQGCVLWLQQGDRLSLTA